MSDQPRIVVAMPNPAEAGTLAEWLNAEGFEPVRRATAAAACEEMQARRFDLLVADIAIGSLDKVLAASRARNPQAPCVLVGDQAALKQIEGRSRAMHLTRPLDRAILVCTVSMAVLDGRPTRRSARKTIPRYATVVNGVPSNLIDVSNEGLRLELPRERQTALPPYFNVRVPLIGVSLTVQRMWVRSWSVGQRPVLWCGGALAQNRAGAERAWRLFVDTVPGVGVSASTARDA
jgi:CheY-like chemotaxis protein